VGLVEINRNPTRRQLRQFGAACLVALPLIGWLWGAPLLVAAALGALGLAAAILAALAPAALRSAFVGLSFVTAPIGWIVGEAILLVVYFGVVVPIGLLGRLAGRDGLQLRLDKQAESYWQPKEQPPDVESYFRRF
jgi:hypothetical protein